jgi:hypothetical protein
MEFIRYSCGGQISLIFCHRGHPPSSLRDYGGQAEDIGVLKQKDLISQIE